MPEHEINGETLDEQPTAVMTAELDVSDIPQWLGTAYAAAAAACEAQGRQFTGPPFARYHRLGPERFVVEAGFPIAAAISDAGDVRGSALPGGEAAIAVHVGPYETMEPTYDAVISWVRDRGGEPVGDAWEVYLSDPQQQPDPATWRTRVVQPYRRSAP